jgi:hypothetical protein
MLCVVPTVHVETRSTCFLIEPHNQCRRFTVSSGLALKPGLRFPVLGIKTGSSGLIIWASKLLRQFFGLGLKITHASVCRLRHKTDGGRTTWGTRRDLAACFIWEQVTLEFLILALRLVKAWLHVVHVASSWRLYREKAKDGWVNVTGCVRSFYPKITVSMY